MSSERFSLAGRNALVTGASRGIGAAIALALARAGADVGVAARSTAELERVATAVRATGRRAVTLGCDLLEDGAVDACAEDAERTLGGIDVLVNNGGGPLFQSPVLGIRCGGWQRTLDLNLTTVLRVCQAVGATMVSRGGGAIINIASAPPTRAWPAIAAYSAAKAAVLNLTGSLAVELGPQGVRVNAVCPGWIRTATNRAYLRDPATAALAVEAVPLGHWGEPEDVAAVAVWLAGDAARYVTGAVIPVDGGLALGQSRRWLDAMTAAVGTADTGGAAP